MRGNAWPDHHKAELFAFWAEGHCNRDIAWLMGRPHGLVAAMVKRESRASWLEVLS